MLYEYTPSQKFDTIRIWVFRDIIRIWRKSTILKGMRKKAPEKWSPKKIPLEKLFYSPIFPQPLIVKI